MNVKSFGNTNNGGNSKYLVAYGWGVNGFFSVLGSVLVVMLSMSYGFKVVFIIAAVLYISAMIVAGRMKKAVSVLKV